VVPQDGGCVNHGVAVLELVDELLWRSGWPGAARSGGDLSYRLTRCDGAKLHSVVREFGRCLGFDVVG